jgi:hypothetical protein
VSCPSLIEMGTPAGAPIVDWSSKTVAISDPLASRSDTRTVVWAFDARMQSGVPTKVFLSLPGDAMQSNGGEILIGADVSKAWIDVCQSETTRGRSHRQHARGARGLGCAGPADARGIASG